MKKTGFFLLAALVGLAACNPAAKSFKVVVDLKNADAKTIYLQKYVDNAPVVIDSAVVVNASAELVAPADDPQILYSIKVKGVRGSMVFFADNKDVSVVGDFENARDVEIFGSETQARLNAYRSQYNAFTDRMMDIYPLLADAYNANDTVAMDSLNALGDAIIDEQNEFRNSYFAENDGFLTHYLLNEVKQDYPLDELKAMREGFAETSLYTDDLDDYIAKLERIEIGQSFVDFTLTDAEGRRVNMAEVVGANKVTMLDFWASWCGPCRRENPVVKAAYEKYHEAGLEIVAVSVDQNEADWRKAVEEDALPYIQALDVADVADSYLVYYIPANFLFDAEGYMIAKNLRGEELENKLAELLP